ncbi:MAG: hypothetical protein KJN82_03445, partial [Bacteroidia bacterium]|nr:hypothetical protein [Bacteroidia bacterium]
GIANGIIFHRIKKNVPSNKSNLIFKYVRLISTTDTINAPLYSEDKLIIPKRNNYLKIGIALPKTPIGNSKQVQYKLEGINNEWSKWNYSTELNFPSLPSGNYNLNIRVRGDNENGYEELSKEFYIKYPWYFSKLAFLVYFIIFIIVNIAYSIYFKRKNKKHLIKIKEEEEKKRKRQIEKFELEKLESEKQMLILKEENMQLEINKKNSELAYSTLNNVKKNELLHDLKKEIKEIDKNVLNNALHSPINNLLRKINNHLVDKEDWLAFELHFRNAHVQFFENLRGKHPNLSSNDIKLSAYLKLNLSSKEIASLMNIAISSVEQGRYRLRKKLLLDPEENLVNYIQKF